MVETAREDIEQINIKLAALEIIISAPLWPRRDDLQESGCRLHDAILEKAKSYALAIAEEQWRTAYAIAGSWSALANEFLDSTKINADDPSEREANNRILAVFKHYLDAADVELSKLAGKERHQPEAAA
ncbi:hypothetical protein [Singulisphaera sp. PoT]|uniref:hypothetical protein n=1 Tax=Singulisphaera sp. PoT TaxID=3411797 RepID=UPI003BF47EEB